jgi:hypothetical protein
MKKCILFTLIVVVSHVSAGCAVPLPSGILDEVSITGSGNVVTREEAITGFDKVDASHAFTVDISRGDTFSVVVRVDDSLLEYLEVVKQGSTLKIGLKPGYNYHVTNVRTTEAEITMPELTGLDLSGASDGTITGFTSTKALAVDLSGASSLEGDIEAGDSLVDLSGGSDLTLSGSGQDLTVDASGASEVDLADFPIADANVDASGASTVTVNASGTLNVDASSASHVYYLGNPTLGTIDTSSGASVESR